MFLSIAGLIPSNPVALLTLIFDRTSLILLADHMSCHFASGIAQADGACSLKLYANQVIPECTSCTHCTNSEARPGNRSFTITGGYRSYLGSTPSLSSSLALVPFPSWLNRSPKAAIHTDTGTQLAEMAQVLRKHSQNFFSPESNTPNSAETNCCYIESIHPTRSWLNCIYIFSNYARGILPAL